MSVQFVLRQLLIKTLAAHAEHFGGRRAVAVSKFQGGSDIMPLDQGDSILDQALKRGLAGLLNDRRKRRLQAGGAFGHRKPPANITQQQRDLVGPGDAELPTAEISTSVSPPSSPWMLVANKSHRTMAVQVGEQHCKVGAGPGKPSAQGFAEDCAFSAGLDDIKERPVGAPYGSIPVNHHERVRQPVNEFIQGWSVRNRRPDWMPLAGASCTMNIGPGSLVISEARTSQARAIRAEMQQYSRRTSGLPDPLQHRLERLPLLGCHFGQQVASARQTKGADRCGIGFDNAQRISLEQQNSLIRGIEQQAIAGFDLPQLPVFLFHRLLSCNEAGLKFGYRPEIASDRDHTSFATKPDGGVFHRDFDAAGKALVKLAESGNTAFASVFQHASDLTAYAVADSVHPGLPAPVTDGFIGDGVRQCYVLNDPVHIQHQGDIRLSHINARERRDGDSSLLVTSIREVVTVYHSLQGLDS